MTELRALTAARGIAAWLVVLYHIRGSIAGLPAPLALFLAKGYLAVDFFFLLSGFVIWLSWHERLRDSGTAGIPRFLQKRIARIWPLHAVMLAAATALALLLATTGRPDPAFPFTELPLHVLLVQNWGSTGTLRWNDPAWSISCELAAYLLFPLLAIALDWRKLAAPACIALALLLLIALHWIMRDQPDLGSDIPRFGLARCVFEFTAGTIVAALWQRARSAWLPTIAAAGLLAGWAVGAPETLVVPAALAAML
ncbi:MAG TPA: acyltransferase, partial [Sphingomonas sp.]|nr:acyltransferase [Sphingomonas sp.]